MSSRKKLVKEALRNFWLYTTEEIAYFQLWLKERKIRKQAKKDQEQFKNL